VKHLDKAAADRDHVFSVNTGSLINFNGKGASPITPEGAMQVETIIDAYSKAKRVPGEAFYVKLQTTGTSVGDPIEANAAESIFLKGCNSKRPLR
jgi:fatty acid synthase